MSTTGKQDSLHAFFELQIKESCPEHDTALVETLVLLLDMVSLEMALTWLQAECKGFDGARPIDLMKTPEGLIKVRNALAMIADGGEY